MTNRITPHELLDHLGENARGYLLTPSSALWFVKIDDVSRGVDGPLKSQSLDHAFEIVAFDSQGGHSWSRHQGTDRGTLQTFPAESWEACPENDMLLAGHVVSSHDGWAWMQGSAATRFAVPVAAQKGDLVTIGVREITAVDDMGNLRVIANVITGLTAHTNHSTEVHRNV